MRLTLPDVSPPGLSRNTGCRVAARLAWMVLCCAAAISPIVASAEEELAGRLPRIPPLSPQAAPASFLVQPGYQLQLVAAEPLVADPIAMSFDEFGRLFVVEMRDYSEQADDRLGVIRMLEDADGDGRMDRSTIFADKLSWPTGVICFSGGVFVAQPPDILFLKDTNGDGRADERRAVITGFSRTNVQGMVNSLTWGLDNRIHGATSSSGGELRVVDAAKSSPMLRANGRDFSFDPRSLDLRLESGGGQHGLSFDDWGRKFVCSNSDHIQLIMYEDRYLGRNPRLLAPSPRVSIAVEGPAADVFRSSPVEPWRVVRTELRVAGKVPGPVEGGGRAAGYFTSATGITIYRGDAWPATDRGLAIVGDVGSNLVHRKRLSPSGLEWRAARIDANSELLASRDIWFRPVQFANAPDGALYIADMYREVIEHPASLPPSIKKHLDLTSGRDRGRIYRLVPNDFRQLERKNIGKAVIADLVAFLDSPNGWTRDTAARLLFARQDRAAIRPLEKLAAGGSPLGRLHALYALAGLRGLTSEIVLHSLDDGDPRIREHAVRLSESLIADSPLLRERLYALIGDNDARVRYQLAFTLGEISAPGATAALARLAVRDGSDAWCRMAVMSSTAGRAGDVLATMLAEPTDRAVAAKNPLVESLAELVGREAAQAQVTRVLDSLAALPSGDAEMSRAIVRGLHRGLTEAKSPLVSLLSGAAAGGAADVLRQLRDQAVRVAQDTNQPGDKRAEAIRSLASLPFAEARALLAPRLDLREPPLVQLAALQTLARHDRPEVASAVIAAWPTLSPELRREAAEALFARRNRWPAIIAAIESRALSSADFEPARLRQLATIADPILRVRAEKIVAGGAVKGRAEVVEAHRDVLKAAGDSARGKATFKKVCAACHRLEGVGQATGPDLAAIRNRGAEAVLLNILDPNREVNPQFLSYIVQTSDGRSLSGMIAAETATSISLRRADGAGDTILRADIEELRSSGLSLMPEGLEKQLSSGDLADVITYLMSLP